MEIRADPVEEVINLRLGKGRRELSDGLDKVVRLDALVGGILSWKNLQLWSRFVSNDGVAGAWVRVLIPLAVQLEDGNPS